jgi:hypothetical protein
VGTNFYLIENVCPHCSRGDERLHIGKSSAGWCFSLHVHPDNGINNLADWEARWNRDDAVIADEYGHSVTPNEMMDRITKREWPNGLSRHDVDGRHCISHGEGTYDLCRGDFS